MSKLDYVTIAIVGICIMAILFLVYKMTNVFNGDKATDKTEISANNVETEAEDVYDYEIDESVDSTGAAAEKGNAATDKTTATKPATTSVPADKAETSATDTQGEDEIEEAVSAATGVKSTPKKGSSATDDAAKATYSDGKFMVLAGSFSIRESADKQVKKLNKLGYENARVELFDKGKYAVVLVDRFGNMAEAEKLVKKLNTDGVKSYVKAKS
ncbi:MAG: SPOR domain-containing protein [Saprospiraceae bacterium]|jgi:cell division protein FtsN|nr:SPOR domain-containing protein [Saprospiraceae bacterium]